MSEQHEVPVRIGTLGATFLLSSPNLDNHNWLILYLYEGAYNDHHYVLLCKMWFRPKNT